MRPLFAIIFSALSLQFAAAQLYTPGSTVNAVTNGSSNVGIGTAAPASKLHVVDGNGGEQIKLTRGTGSVLFVQDYNMDDLYLLNSDASKTLMFWGQDGNVGIGIYPADYKLHIKDGIGGAQLKFQRGTGVATIVQDNNVNNLYFDAPAGLLLNTGGGNVGIGTTTPDYRLHIKDGNGGTQLKFQRGTGVATIDQDNNINDLYISAASGLFLNYNGGNVGIGTYQPGALLHLGTSNLGYVRTVRMMLEPPQHTGAAWEFSVRDDASSSFLGIGYGAEQITVQNNGNVGIGTATPGSFKLAVNGKIWTQEVNVAMTNPGPDYVFEKEYDLLSLPELETYIKANKHLPEIPSAKEMEANGLNLKEMNLLLLKKVEELTLHVIEQNKTIAQQGNRIEILEQKLTNK